MGASGDAGLGWSCAGPGLGLPEHSLLPGGQPPGTSGRMCPPMWS